MNPIRLVVGLGNPGPEYADTRHNAGFWLVDALAQQTHVCLRPERRYHGRVARTSLAGQELWLLEPETYMNASGQAVHALAAYYRVAPAEILVVHDELDLPPGTARLKKGGGAGGHNGLKDVIARLGPDFWRLRLGIGHPGSRDEVVDYVLRRPPREEAERITEAIGRSLDILPLVVRGDLETAMHRLHSRARPAGGSGQA